MGGFFATNVGHFQPLGIEGWRFAFYFVAAISLIVCGLVLKYAADPRKKVKSWIPLYTSQEASSALKTTHQSEVALRDLASSRGRSKDEPVTNHIS